MTNAERENAIRCLKLWIERESQLQTYKTCLEALEQQPTVQDKQAESEKYQKAFDDGYANGYAQARFDYEQQPCDKCVYSTKDGYCQYDDITETIPPLDPCDEAVSRQAALNSLIDNTNLEGYDLAEALDAIDNKEKLPAVTPQQKTGRWIIIDDCEQFIAKCSECGRLYDSRIISKYPYCHCGAKMESEEE